VAVTVIACEEVTEGAVNSPDCVTAPWLADQLTAVLLVLVTTAVNCLWPLEGTDAVTGDTETAGLAVLGELGGVDVMLLAGVLVETPHPDSEKEREMQSRIRGAILMWVTSLRKKWTAKLRQQGLGDIRTSTA
jgi:hypothetical protein